MKNLKNLVDSAVAFIDQKFFYLLIGAYLTAGLWPGPGLALRRMSLFPSRFGLSAIAMNFRLPALMLSLLLFVVGLSVDYGELGKLVRRPKTLLAGTLANTLLPLIFTFVMAALMVFWHNPKEAQEILVGLAFVASTPIAASSAAWSQKVDGNLSLSLGLVVISTLISPVVTPASLRAVSLVTTDDYAEDLSEVADNNAGLFLAVAVLAPAAFGLGLQAILGAERIEPYRKALKALNLLDLLLLNYSNATVAIPEVLAAPDWDFLAVILLIVATLCGLAFWVGWGLGGLLKASAGDRCALMFAMGMNNNGSSLVLSSLTMADHPAVVLPIILYNLIQQIIAGLVETAFLRRASGMRELS